MKLCWQRALLLASLVSFAALLEVALALALSAVTALGVSRSYQQTPSDGARPWSIKVDKIRAIAFLTRHAATVCLSPSSDN